MDKKKVLGALRQVQDGLPVQDVKFKVGDKVLVGRKKEKATISRIGAGFSDTKGGYMVQFDEGGSASVSEKEVFKV